MKDFILLMHRDASAPVALALWPDYFAKLKGLGVFQGGSAIGPGAILRKDGTGGEITNHLTGYIRIQAKDLNAARVLVIGNPVFESGGSVEIRELPQD